MSIATRTIGPARITVYGPPVYGHTRIECWFPYTNLSIAFSPSIGVSARLDRYGLVLSLGLIIGVSLVVTFPHSWNREVLFKRLLLWNRK